MYTACIIRLNRRRVPWRNRLAKYRVEIDGHVVGSIAQGETRDFTVLPGEHTIRMSSDRIFTSPERTVSLDEGELVEFLCGPGGPSIESLLFLLRPHRYISLDGPQWPSRSSPTV
jgi:hypothetical protein